MELLAPRFRVLAPDSYGSGKSPEWPSDRQIQPCRRGRADRAGAARRRLAADPGRPLLRRGDRAAGGPGPTGARSRAWCCTSRPCSRSSTPTRRRRTPPTASARRWPTAALALDRGDRHRGGRGVHRLLDGRRHLAADARAAAPADRRLGRQRSPLGPRALHRADTAAGVSHARRAGAVPGRRQDDRRRPAAWRASSLDALPRVEVLEFAELGHMGPVTHPEQVNAAIARFLDDA